MEDKIIKNTTAICIAFAGLLIIGFNLYRLQVFDFRWNYFTYESWVMLLVGLVLVLPQGLPILAELGRGNLPRS